MDRAFVGLYLPLFLHGGQRNDRRRQSEAALCGGWSIRLAPLFRLAIWRCCRAFPPEIPITLNYGRPRNICGGRVHQPKARDEVRRRLRFYVALGLARRQEEAGAASDPAGAVK
jgi:hypothetical protein